MLPPLTSSTPLAQATPRPDPASPPPPAAAAAAPRLSPMVPNIPALRPGGISAGLSSSKEVPLAERYRIDGEGLKAKKGTRVFPCEERIEPLGHGTQHSSEPPEMIPAETRLRECTHILRCVDCMFLGKGTGRGDRKVMKYVCQRGKN